MIVFVRGILENIINNNVIIDCNGIGYNVLVSNLTVSNLPKIGESVKIYTNMQVREDGVSLYGFLSMEELNMFNILVSVSGVGPKLALSVLSSLSPSKVIMAIATDDIITLSKVSGVGKKTAQRVILELKDKVKANDVEINNIQTNQQLNNLSSNEKQDAIDALISLGYNRSEAIKGVMEVALEGMKTEQIIKLSLKILNKH